MQKHLKYMKLLISGRFSLKTWPTYAIKLAKLSLPCTINLLHPRCTNNRLGSVTLTDETGSLKSYLL